MDSPQPAGTERLQSEWGRASTPIVVPRHRLAHNPEIIEPRGFCSREKAAKVSNLVKVRSVWMYQNHHEAVVWGCVQCKKHFRAGDGEGVRARDARFDFYPYIGGTGSLRQDVEPRVIRGLLGWYAAER